VKDLICDPCAVKDWEKYCSVDYSVIRRIILVLRARLSTVQFFLLGYLILLLSEMSLHEDSDLNGGEIPLDAEVTKDLRIHLMSIKGTNKKLRTKVKDMSANIAGVEERLNVRLTTSDRQRDDSLREVTESLNRLNGVVQRLEERDATPR
jgi:hypothetical protein